MAFDPAWTREMTVKGRHSDCLKQGAVVEYLREVLDQAERELDSVEGKWRAAKDLHITLTAVEVIGVLLSALVHGDKLRMTHRDLHAILSALTLDHLQGDPACIPAAVAAVERWASWMAAESPYDLSLVPVDADALDDVRTAIWGPRPAPGPFTDITPEALVSTITWRGYRLYHALNYQDKADGWCADFTGPLSEQREQNLTPSFAGFTLPQTIDKIARQPGARPPEPLAKAPAPAAGGSI
jgi:hypothetical protein